MKNVAHITGPVRTCKQQIYEANLWLVPDLPSGIHAAHIYTFIRCFER